MHDLTERKRDLIQEVSQIRDERDVAQLENVVRQIRERQEVLQKYQRPTRKKTDLAAIKQERGFKGHDKEEIFRLIREINIQEPIELLLSQLTK